MKRIGLLGAFSIDNTGDVLLGLAARQALARFSPGAEVQVFAPRLADRSWRHDFSGRRGVGAAIEPVPVRGPLDWARGLDALVIGGGGFLLPSPDFDVFLLGDAADWRRRGVPAAWNAVCALGGDVGSPTWMRKLRACCEALDYVSVRNPASREIVQRSGFRGEVAVVPDGSLGLDLPPAPGADDVLARAGVDRRRPLVGLSVGRTAWQPRAAPFFARLYAALARLDAELVIFPVGNVYRDAEHQRAAAHALPQAKWIREPLDPLLTAGLIGRMELYVGTRLHAVLAAFLQDVPFVVLDEYRTGPRGTSKVRELVVEAGLEARYLCPVLGGDPEVALAQPRADVAPARAAMRARLDAHYVAMLARLGL